MDDIINKLKLLDYETSFCWERDLPCISHVFFSNEEEENVDKALYFYELCYWLASKSDIKLSYMPFTSFDVPRAAIVKLVKDLKKLKLRLPPYFQQEELERGYG